MANLCKHRHKCSKFRFSQRFGYKNGTDHLLSCIGKCSYLTVLKLYNEEKSHKKKYYDMREHFTSNVMPVSLKEEDLLSWA